MVIIWHSYLTNKVIVRKVSLPPATKIHSIQTLGRQIRRAGDQYSYQVLEGVLFTNKYTGRYWYIVNTLLLRCGVVVIPYTPTRARTRTVSKENNTDQVLYRYSSPSLEKVIVRMYNLRGSSQK